MRRTIRAALFVIAAVFGSIPIACGDAVTDPLREGRFEADPRPILGTWFTELPDGSLDPEFDLVVERGAGTLFGEILISEPGRIVQLFFAEVDNWDGSGFHFFDSQTLGLPGDGLEWNVRLRPVREVVDRCPSGEEVVRVRPARVDVSTSRINVGATYRRPGTIPLDDQPLDCPVG